MGTAYWATGKTTGFPVLPGKDLLAAVLEFQIEPVPDIIELVLEGYQIAAQTPGKGNFDAAFAYLSINVLVFLKSCPLAHPFQQLPGIRRSLLGQGGGKGKKHGGHSRKKVESKEYLRSMNCSYHSGKAEKNLFSVTGRRP